MSEKTLTDLPELARKVGFASDIIIYCYSRESFDGAKELLSFTDDNFEALGHLLREVSEDLQTIYDAKHESKAA